MTESDTSRESEALARETPPPRMFMVVIHNDDHTTMEFVVRVLITVFRKKPEDAAALMMEVHGKGRGVAGVYTCDIAESLAEKALGEARGAGYPLVITVEEDGGG